MIFILFPQDNNLYAKIKKLPFRALGTPYAQVICLVGTTFFLSCVWKLIILSEQVIILCTWDNCPERWFFFNCVHKLIILWNKWLLVHTTTKKSRFRFLVTPYAKLLSCAHKIIGPKGDSFLSCMHKLIILPKQVIILGAQDDGHER